MPASFSRMILWFRKRKPCSSSTAQTQALLMLNSIGIAVPSMRQYRFFLKAFVSHGLDRIEQVKVALETDDRLKIAASVESVLDFFLMLKIRAEAKMAELKNS